MARGSVTTGWYGRCVGASKQQRNQPGGEGLRMAASRSRFRQPQPEGVALQAPTSIGHGARLPL